MPSKLDPAMAESRGRTPSWLPSRRTVLLFVAGGFGLAAVLELGGWVVSPGPTLLGWAFDPVLDLRFDPHVVYGVAGVLLVGGLVTVVYDRYGLLTPPAIVAIMLVNGWYLESTSATPPGAVTAPYSLFLAGWPVVLAVALCVGAVEKGMFRP